MYQTIFLEFLKLGFLAFGGPAGHIALMHKRFVEELKWIDASHFLDLISLSSIIPGPSSTELTLLIGRHKGGKLGLWIAGISFILPAFIMVTILAVLYVSYGNLPIVSQMFYFVLPVMVAIIISVTFKLSKTSIKSYEDIFFIVFAFGLSFLINQVFVFIMMGVLAWLLYIMKHAKHTLREGVTIWMLFVIFFQIGATLYGSGYVLVSYLQTYFVDSEILSLEVILDAVAVGQITPGPVFTTAAFIGFITTQNILGAFLSALGIFLPGFLLITFFYQKFEKIRKHPKTSVILKALHAAAIGLLLHVIFDYALVLSQSWLLIVIGMISSILLLFNKAKPTHLILVAIAIIVIVSFT